MESDDALDSLDVARLIEKDASTRSLFGGCVPADRLTDELANAVPGSLFLVNTDESWKPGRHWLALCVENEDVVELFDSYGLGALAYPAVRRALVGSGKTVLCDGRRLQAIGTRTCGHFCVAYCLAKSRGVTLDDVVGYLRKKGGDAFVYDLLHPLVVRARTSDVAPRAGASPHPGRVR